MKIKIAVLLLVAGLSQGAFAEEGESVNLDFSKEYQEQLKQAAAPSVQPVRETESLEWKRHKEILSYIDRHDRD